MILTPQILARLGLFALVGVLLQLSFFSRVTFLHTSADILPALVVVIGLLGGGVTGAVIGFSVGLLVDSLTAGTLGASSLVLLGVGYAAGLFRERFEFRGLLVPGLLCAGLTLAAEIGFGVVELMLGLDAPLSGLLVRDLLLKAIAALALGIAIYVIARRLLRPALVDEGGPRRRPRTIGARG